MIVTDFERHLGLDFLRDRFDECLVEVCNNLHRKLRLDLVVADEVVEGVGECDSNTKCRQCQRSDVKHLG